MSGQHIVIGGNDADVGTVHHLDNRFVFFSTGGNTMGQITAAQLAPVDRLGRHLVDIPAILMTQCSASGSDIEGDAKDFRIHRVSLRINM